MAKKKKTIRRGPPLGSRNNPDGRPRTVGGEHRISISVPDATWEAIDKAAKARNLSKAEFVRSCIEIGLEQ